MQPANLQSSRWAPSTSRRAYDLRTPAVRSNLDVPVVRKSSGEKKKASQISAFQKFLRCLRRLKWKSTSLLFCHHRALHQQTDNYINNVNFPIMSDSTKANAAEINFKLDFFEYYGLLERTLVNLLECFSMVITADYTSDHVPLPASETNVNRDTQSGVQRVESSIIGDSVAFYGYTHRFHANVFAALDKESNPLHPILGMGIVRQYLGLAKEFRNRWKEAENEEHIGGNNLNIPKPYHQILQDLRLDQMLETILSALEQSRLVAASHLASSHPLIDVDMINVDDETLPEFAEIDDAMDWD